MDKQRVLLIHPLGYDAKVAGRDISRLANLMPPLGLASMAADRTTRGTTRGRAIIIRAP